MKVTNISVPIDERSYSIQKPTHGGSKELVRYKRGLVSVLFKGASILGKRPPILGKVTSIFGKGVSIFGTPISLGIILGDVISEGCLSHPRICTNKDEIENLDKKIKQSVTEYDREYATNKRNYLEIRTATINNRYIQYYINQSIQAVKSIEDIQEDLILILLPKISGIHKASQNVSYDQYLETVIGKFENILSIVQDMLNKAQGSVMERLALNYAVEICMFKAQTWVWSIAKSTSLADKIAHQLDPSFGDRKSRILRKIKLVPKVFKAIANRIGQNIKTFVTNIKTFVGRNTKTFAQNFNTFSPKAFGKNIKTFGRNIKSLKQKKTWKELKGKLIHTLKKPVAKFSKIKSIFSLKTIKMLVNKFRNRSILGLVGEAAVAILSNKEWEGVDIELQQAREQHADYYKKLNKELRLIKIEKQTMNRYWSGIIDIFKNTSQSFKDLIIDASQHLELLEVVGQTRLSIDTSSPFFAINFDNVNQQNITLEQNKVLEFLRKADYDITVVKDELKAYNTLYDHVLTESRKNETVHHIWSVAQTMFDFSKSITMKNFGKHLTLKIVVCTVSVLRSDLIEYDFYPLEPFRPKCDVSDSIFQTLKSESDAKRKRTLMRSIVKKEVNNGKESLSRVLDIVQNTYAAVLDQDLNQFGSKISEKDIICVIAEEFGTKQKYDFIPLASFRPDCSQISQERFQQLQDKATKLRLLSESLKTFLGLCKSQIFCPCISTIANQQQVTENDVVDVLKQMDPQWKPNQLAVLCGQTGCDCEHL